MSNEPKHIGDDREIRFDALIRLLADGIVIVDFEGNVVFMNPAAEILLGRRLQELQGQPLGFPIVSGESTEIDIFRKGNGAVSAEMRVVKTAWNGKPAHIASLRDISERIQLQDVQAKARMQDALSLYSRGIAHDFNNLLSIITMAVSMAKASAAPGSIDQENFSEVLEACAKMKTLISILTEISKTTPTDHIKGPLNALIKRTVAPIVETPRILLKIALPDELWCVDHNPGQIQTVLEILLNNALEAVEAGTITVRAENMIVDNPPKGLSQGRYVMVSITDEGPGIPKENLERIFDPYFSTKDRSTQKGMGLSLSIAESIIKQYKGAITVDTASGEGASFHVYLPMVEPDKEP